MSSRRISGECRVAERLRTQPVEEERSSDRQDHGAEPVRSGDRSPHVSPTSDPYVQREPHPLTLMSEGPGGLGTVFPISTPAIVAGCPCPATAPPRTAPVMAPAALNVATIFHRELFGIYLSHLRNDFTRKVLHPVPLRDGPLRSAAAKSARSRSYAPTDAMGPDHTHGCATIRATSAGNQPMTTAGPSRSCGNRRTGGGRPTSTRHADSTTDGQRSHLSRTTTEAAHVSPHQIFASSPRTVRRPYAWRASRPQPGKRSGEDRWGEDDE
jgi:hypothetical protein